MKKNKALYAILCFVGLVGCAPANKLASDKNQTGSNESNYGTAMSDASQLLGAGMNTSVSNAQPTTENKQTKQNVQSAAETSSLIVSNSDLTTIKQTKSTVDSLIPKHISTKGSVKKGVQYKKGTNGEVDLEKARTYLTVAAKRGSTKAMNELGKIYYQGSPRDWVKAGELFYAATLKGNTDAMCNLAYMYRTGRGMPHDPAKAFELYKEAADKGYVKAYARTGNLLYRGNGPAQSYAHAIEYFRKGEVSNDRDCIFMLGECYMRGYGVELDAAKAKDYFKRAQQLGQTHAFEELILDTPDKIAANPPKLHSSVTAIKQRGINTDRLPIPSSNTTIADSLKGTWKGTMYIYDWSGNLVTKEDKMTLQLLEAGGDLVGKWYVNGKFTFSFIAKPTDKCWSVTKQSANDTIADYFDLTTLTCKINAKGNNSWLSGNLACIYKKTNEIEHLNFFILDKEKSMAQDTTFVINKVYPNPFSNQMKVDFTVKRKDAITFTIHDMQGISRYAYITKEYETGVHTVTLSPSLLPGVYNLIATGQQCVLNKPIIKQ
jgi:TPR repeat protein